MTKNPLVPEFPGLPGAADQLFSTQDEGSNDARLNWASSAWSLYADGYKEAADALVERVEKRAGSQDTLVYPILFLYRQYFELQLKLSIRTVRRFLDEGHTFPQGHRLERLWSELGKV